MIIQHKLKKAVLGTMCVCLLVGCVNYPQQYTYSPTVTYGNSGGDPALPDPFGRGNHNRTTTVNQQDTYYSDAQEQVAYYPYPTITIPVDPNSPPPPNPWYY